MDAHYYQSSFIASFSIASVSIKSIDLYDSNFLQFLSVLSQKTELQLKTLAIKIVIHITTKQFIFIFQKSNSLNNVVFILFNSFGYINWRNNLACRILWEVMMCLLHHSLWHESWPIMFQMKVDRYKRYVGNFSSSYVSIESIRNKTMSFTLYFGSKTEQPTQFI